MIQHFLLSQEERHALEPRNILKATTATKKDALSAHFIAHRMEGKCHQVPPVEQMACINNQAANIKHCYDTDSKTQITSHTGMEQKQSNSRLNSPLTVLRRAAEQLKTPAILTTCKTANTP